MPKKITLSSPAKVNLYLKILKKTPSGYHEIQTILHEIPQLADEITILESEKDEVVMTPPRGGLEKIPQAENLAYKALKLIKSTFRIKKHAKIKIKKRIPIASGLGGASSNAATVLKGLNQLWNLKLSTEKLEKLGATLGMDVPFFIRGGTALGTHFGEKITPLPPLKIKIKILPKKSWPKIRVPKNQTKTAHLYSKIDLKKLKKQQFSKSVNSSLVTEKNPHEITPPQSLNDFETLYKMPPSTHLSGAGPAVFKILKL